MNTLEIFRPPTTSIVVIQIDEKTVFSKKLMGEHIIVSEFISSSILPIQIGDYIIFLAENYYINRLPSIEKINNNTYKYQIQFESTVYNLNKKLIISSDLLADFSYNGTASDFITLIISNINEIDGTPAWSLGTIDTTIERTLRFTNESCLAALKRVAEAFDKEFEIASKSISLKSSVGADTTYRFEYGRDLGLYKLERQQVQDQNIVTKVYGFGGETNIPSGYRDGAKRLKFTAGSGTLTKNTTLYGTIEGQFTDNDIYPNRTSTLTTVNYAAASGWNANTDYLVDSAMNFNLNNNIIAGQTAKIVFKSGDIEGVECEIWKYDNNASGFYITPFTDSDGYVQPNAIAHPHAGDSYTLVNISLPQSYIDTAETTLQVATQAYLDENCIPMVVYAIEIDPKYASSITLDLDAGDKVTVVDTALGINSLIRVNSIEFPLVDSYQIKATIADFIPYTLQERLIKSAISTRKETVFVDRRVSEQARRNTVNQKSLRDLLFDTDMYFDPVNLKPLSIETAYLAVGTKSRDFWLSNVTIKANYLSDANRIYISAGSLIHLQIEITGLGYTWVIGSALDQASLTPASAYYLYARCSKAALTGNWVLSTSQITVEQETGYYHFLVGMLFAVADGWRNFDFTNGMTYINGNTITTGKIQSIDTNNYLDLTNNKFKIGNASGFVDWNDSASGVLTVKGAVVSDLVMAEYATIENLAVQYFNGIPVLAGDLDGTVVNTQANYPLSAQWDSGFYYVIDDKCSNVAINYISNASGVNHEPPNVEYWDVDPNQPVARIDTVTLNTGTSGTANILCDGVTKLATFFNSYTETATAFAVLYAADYLTGGVVVTSSGADIIFTAQTAGVNFTGNTTITNVANKWKGAVNIEGNDIWENEEDNDDYGVVKINQKGYHGGVTRRRITIIGGGLGYSVAIFSPTEKPAFALRPGLDIRVGALSVPRLTTAERDAFTGENGMIIYNTTTGHFQGYDQNWYNITLS